MVKPLKVNKYRAGHVEPPKSTAYIRAPKQEREVADKLGGYLTPASGSRFKKGDAIVPGVARVECKCTGAKSFSVTREMLDKIEAAGMLNDEIPYIEIEFIENGSGRILDKAIVCKEAAFSNLLRRLQSSQSGDSSGQRSIGRPERNRIRLAPKSK